MIQTKLNGSAVTRGGALFRSVMVWLARGMNVLPASILVFLLGHASALAQTESDAAPAVSMAALQRADAEMIHSELRALKATMERALNEMDIDTILANVSDDVIFTTMNGDVARGPAGIRKYFETMMNGPNPRVLKVVSRFEVEDLSNLYGRDFAVAFGSSKDHYELAGGESFDVTGRWSGTMIHRDGRWLIANFHYSTNMFDNPILDAQRKYLIGLALAVAAALALLAFWIGRAYGRRIKN
jgi:uncharacterized protein (TIGR02246 family)